MTDLVLIVVTSLMFLFGWFLMKQLDFILDENQKSVHLGEDISPDEFEEMLSRFHSNHAHVKIIIYDSEQISFPDNESGWIR